MNPLKTILGKDIPVTTKGILFLCQLNRRTKTLTVVSEILFDDALDSLHAYANIPNPESQLVAGKTFDEMIIQLNALKAKIDKKEWIEELIECI